MSEPLTPHEVEQELRRFVDMLATATTTHAAAARAEAIARADYEITFAHAFKTATGTDANRTAEARIVAEKELRKYREKQGELSAVERRIRSYEEQIRAMQSIGASVRAAIGGPL